jgi:hypothetical protein
MVVLEIGIAVAIFLAGVFVGSVGEFLAVTKGYWDRRDFGRGNGSKCGACVERLDAACETCRADWVRRVLDEHDIWYGRHQDLFWQLYQRPVDETWTAKELVEN